MKTYIVAYRTESGDFGTRKYSKKVEALSLIEARARFHEFMRKKDSSQGRFGIFSRWFEITSIVVEA